MRRARLSWLISPPAGCSLVHVPEFRSSGAIRSVRATPGVEHSDPLWRVEESAWLMRSAAVGQQRSFVPAREDKAAPSVGEHFPALMAPPPTLNCHRRNGKNRRIRLAGLTRIDGMEPVFVTAPELQPVLEELRMREPIFHKRQFGTNRKDFEAMTADEFWEVGAS